MTHRATLLVAALLILGGCSSPGSEPEMANPDTALQHEPLSFMGLEVDDEVLTEALESYLVIADRLAEDSMEGVHNEAANVARLLDDMAGDHEDLQKLAEHADELATADDIAAARHHFGLLSPPFADLVADQNTADEDVYRMDCGMADAPGGGVWLQRGREVRNPYFGADMLRCARDVDQLIEA